MMKLEVAIQGLLLDNARSSALCGLLARLRSFVRRRPAMLLAARRSCCFANRWIAPLEATTPRLSDRRSAVPRPGGAVALRWSLAETGRPRFPTAWALSCPQRADRRS